MSRGRWRDHVTAALAAVVLLASTAVPARAAEPGLSVSNAKLARALHCQPQVRDARRTRGILVAGAGLTGRESCLDGANTALALRAAGHPSCYVDCPAYTTGDIQTSV